jgi:hypothetical protein
MPERKFNRRDALKLFAGLGAAALAGCNGNRELGSNIASTNTLPSVPNISALDSLQGTIDAQQATINANAYEMQKQQGQTSTATSADVPDQSTQTATATETPTPVREQIGAGVDVLGPNKVIDDSVWPGGISQEINGFPVEEVQTVVDIYNGTTRQTGNPRNLEKLSAARAYAESVFDVRGTIDANTLQPDSEGYRATGADGTEALWFRVSKAQAPEGYTYNQIAVGDYQTGQAYVNNGSLISGEFLYVVRVYNSAAQLKNTLTFRSACGNIGREGEALPQPTPGPTQPPRATPTGSFRPSQTPGGPTSTPTGEFHPSSTPTQPVPTTEVPRPTDTPFVPTVTNAPTQPPQPTATGVGTTPNVPTPLPTSAPIETPVVQPPTPIPGSNPTSVFGD